MCLPLGYFSPLLDKDLQLPSGFNCNFDFPDEPCGWMYDHAKWLRSTGASSSSPNDRTFPGKPALTAEPKGLRPACSTSFSSRVPSGPPDFPPQSNPLLLAHKPPQSLLTTSQPRIMGLVVSTLRCDYSTAWKLGGSERGQDKRRGRKKEPLGGPRRWDESMSPCSHSQHSPPPSQSLLSTSGWVLFQKWLVRKPLASSLTDPSPTVSLRLWQTKSRARNAATPVGV